MENQLTDMVQNATLKSITRIIPLNLNIQSKNDIKRQQTFVIKVIMDVLNSKNVIIYKNAGYFYIRNKGAWEAITKIEMGIFLSDAAFKIGISELLTKHYTFINSLIKQFETLISNIDTDLITDTFTDKISIDKVAKFLHNELEYSHQQVAEILKLSTRAKAAYLVKKQ